MLYPVIMEDSKIIDEITKSLVILGAKSDLLSIIGSWSDTLSDKEVLESLKHWNNSKVSELKLLISELDRANN